MNQVTSKGSLMISKFRHELKYICSDAELAAMQLRLSHLMRRDPHTRSDGTYLIRSIYYDDYDNSYYNANEDGSNDRKKWRIRSYNLSRDNIKLECKRKFNGMIQKKSCTIKADQYDFVTDRNRLLHASAMISADNPPLLNEFLLLCQTTCLKPAVIVQYERRPFIYHEGNVRVTFDRSISSSCDIGGFFDEKLSVRPIMPVGTQLLEVKYDEFLSDSIYRTIQKRDMNLTTFSKYYLCRRFGIS